MLITANALNRSGYSPQNVAAIAVSAQALTILPMHIHGKSTYSALFWMDRRYDQQCSGM